MSETSSELFAPGRDQLDLLDRPKGRDCFLSIYPSIEAIYREAKKAQEVIDNFQQTAERLEAELKLFYSIKSRGRKDTLAAIAAKHSFLALIYWLYPNHAGYSRVRNAERMFDHASAAKAISPTSFSLSYAIGTFVQLRIAAFLIKAKKKTAEDLAGFREEAIRYLSQTVRAKEGGLSCIVLDGLGFSYFLFERNYKTAFSLLAESALCLESWKRDNLDKDGLRFMNSVAAALFWDLGNCFEGQAEVTEGDQMFDHLNSARRAYQKSLECAMKSPWHIYRAMSAYNLSGTYYKEACEQFEREKALPLLKKAINLGEESLKWFHLWSTLEEDFVGGSWIASFYQHLANYSDDAPTKEELMQRSLELAQKAEALVSNKKVGLSRYRAVNVGDIFLRSSEYGRQLAAELRSQERDAGIETRLKDILTVSLSNCLKSREYYTDKAFESRKITAELLAGDVCFDLAGAAGESRRVEYYRNARRHFRDVARLSERLGLNETLATSSWRIAQVYDNEGRFVRSAAEYRKAHESFQQMLESSSLKQLYADSSNYMLAWSEIEQAKSEHLRSRFEESSSRYEEASRLIASTRRWKSRSQLFFAQSLIERAENLSLSQSSERNCVEVFLKAKSSLAVLNSKLSADNSIEAKSFLKMAKRLSTFCDARILLENSKKDFRTGAIVNSISGLSDAEALFSGLAKDYSFANPLEANELESLASFCDALKCIQMAQLDNHPKLIQKAESIFAAASEKSKSSSLKPLLKGLSSFASFLYSCKVIEESLDSTIDLEQFARCTVSLESAEQTLSRLGNRPFLAMLRSSRHILDASIKLSAAEREVEDQEAKDKLYTEAQRSLSFALKYYEELGASEKLRESAKLLSTIKKTRELVPLANKMFVELAQSQMIYSAVSSTSIAGSTPENSAREIDSSFLTLDVSAEAAVISPSDLISITICISNLGKENATAVSIEDILPVGFELIETSDPRVSAKMVERSLKLNRRLGPGATETFKAKIRPSSYGEFSWQPKLIHESLSGNKGAIESTSLKVVVEPSNPASQIEELRSKKTMLERDLSSLGEGKESFYETKEELSKVEEELNRRKHEYENLCVQLEQVKQDIVALKTLPDAASRSEERKKLELEQDILLQRIERRRGIFQ